jgi:hypothetical protein
VKIRLTPLLVVKNPWDRPLNAITCSWLEDTEDERFPYNQPCKGYSTVEFKERLSVVRCQLDILTRVLLEMKGHRSHLKGRPSGLIHDTGALYDEINVEFLQRSVKDFLFEVWIKQVALPSYLMGMCLRIPWANVQFGMRLSYGRLITGIENTACVSIHNPNAISGPEARTVLLHLWTIIES